MAELTEATELLQLATAELQAGHALLPDSMAAISSRINMIAALAADILPRLSVNRLQELLEQHGISCSSASSSSNGANATQPQKQQQQQPPPEWCNSSGELLMHLVPLLRLPVCLVGPKGKLLASAVGCGISEQQQGQQDKSKRLLRKGQVPSVNPVSDPFGSFGTALLQQPCEVVAHYLQRMFFRLLSVVPVEYMRELRVPCQRTDSRSRCISYLPAWVTAQAITIDKRTGRAHVTGPSTCAGGGSSSQAACVAAGGDKQQQQQGAGGGSGSSTSECSAATAAGSTGSTQAQQHQGGMQLCGILHIRSISSDVSKMPGVRGLLTAEQQALLSPDQQAWLRRATEAAAAARAKHSVDTPSSNVVCLTGNGNGACSSPSPQKQGVYYHYYPDIPAVLDSVMVLKVG